MTARGNAKTDASGVCRRASARLPAPLPHESTYLRGQGLRSAALLRAAQGGPALHLDAEVLLQALPAERVAAAHQGLKLPAKLGRQAHLAGQPLAVKHLF